MQYNIKISALDLLSTKGLPNWAPKEFKRFHTSLNFLHEILYTYNLILQRDFFIETELKLIMNEATYINRGKNCFRFSIALTCSVQNRENKRIITRAAAS